jgi:hypothetical protein
MTTCSYFVLFLNKVMLLCPVARYRTSSDSLNVYMWILFNEHFAWRRPSRLLPNSCHISQYRLSACRCSQLHTETFSRVWSHQLSPIKRRIIIIVISTYCETFVWYAAESVATKLIHSGCEMSFEPNRHTVMRKCEHSFVNAVQRESKKYIVLTEK